MNDATTQNDSGREALADALNTSFRLLRFALLAVLVAYAFSGVFVVRQHEKAVVLVLGRTAGLGDGRVLGPGIHLTWPRPFAEVVRVPAGRVQTLESRAFWYAEQPAFMRDDRTPPPATLDPLADGSTLTADANVIHSAWAVRYTIGEPERFLFAYADVRAVLSNELAHAVVKSSARFPVDRALRLDIEGFRDAVESELRRRMQALAPGLRIERVEVAALAPPRQVAPAFEAVIAAEQERSEKTSVARAEATRSLNEAAGAAERIRAEGAARRQRLVAETKADADYFEQVYDKYRQNPQITAQTLWQDTLRRVLASAAEKYVIASGGEGRQELRLLLGPEQQRPGAAGQR